ncbi:MAG: hypothetical protein JNM07_09315 [Phycisphaerae bacterium]|nr:hypothetical protein [Phycisphaerae bacterium]
MIGSVHGTIAGWILGLGAAAAAPAQVWTELGPSPVAGGPTVYTGRISALLAHPTNANLYYAAGADGGVWRSSDGGASWSPLTDHMPTLSMGCLAMDPADPGVIYAGTGEANFANHSRYGLGVYKTTDGGDTWTQLAESVFAGRCISSIVINPLSTSVLYAGVTRAGGFPAPAAAKGHPLANGARGVFKSVDGGVTWTQLGGAGSGLPRLDATALAIDPTNPSVVYAAIGFIFGDASNGVYKSLDAGATWTRLAGGLPTSGNGRIGLGLARTNPSRLYAHVINPADASGGSGTFRGVYRTDDAGATWTQLGTAPSTNTYGWYFASVGVSPTDAGVAFFGGLDVARVTSGSSTTTLSPPHPDVHAFAFDAAGRVLVGTDGGVFRLPSATSSSFTVLNHGLGTIQCYAGLSTHPTDANVMTVGTQDNGTWRREPSGAVQWTPIYGGDGGWTQIDQMNPSVIYLEYQGTGSLYRSTNGGGSFSWIGSGITGRNCFLPPFLIDPGDSNRLVYATERVWQSLNAGATWTALSTDLTSGGSAAIRTIAVAPSDPRYVYVATNDGRVLVSTNSGAAFALSLSGNPGWPRVTRELFVLPDDPRTVYLAGSGFGVTQIRRTTDAGATWSPLDAGLPDVPVNTVAADHRYPRPRLYAGTDAGVLVSRDEGATWSVLGQGLPRACVIDFRFEPGRFGAAGGRLVAATQGRGVWSVPVYCPADFNQDGAVDDYDFFDFLNAFLGGDAAGDFNADGATDDFDYFDFANLFFGGC